MMLDFAVLIDGLKLLFNDCVKINLLFSNVAMMAIPPLNNFVWSIAVYILVAIGIYTTYKLGFMQLFRLKKNASLLLVNLKKKRHSSHSISSFEAVCMAVGSRTGVNGIAAVAVAIVAGGPGAVFWMWVFAILASSIVFIESTLGQLYKEKKSDGVYYGGPAYYAMKGLKNKRIATCIAIVSILSFTVGFGGAHAAFCTATMIEAFSFDFNEYIFGFVFAIMIGMGIAGGRRRIGKIATTIVPLIAMGWVVFAAIVIIMNNGNVFSATQMIFNNAFNMDALVGGGLGAVITIGLKKGMFSSDAGLGATANISASSKVDHPAEQGLMLSFSILIDAFLICTMTAFVILSYGDFQSILDLNVTGAVLIQQIVSKTWFGSSAPYIVCAFMTVFAFTSTMSYYIISENNLKFITEDKRYVTYLRLFMIIVVFVACVTGSGVLIVVSDLMKGLIGVTNAIIIGLLSPKAVAVYKDYVRQKKEGIDTPVFHKSFMKDNDGITEWN